MKTSNIILISFLTFLFGGITLLFIGSKYYKGVDNKANLTVKEKKTASFSVVVAEPGAYLVLKNGREFSVSQAYKKDTKPDFAPFVVRNDTLLCQLLNLKQKAKGLLFPKSIVKM
ncbi:hypothetical protein ACSV4D_05150 [Flavobacterium sp. ARAG 55.4]|uniref:hypothetical protein n=1 Tax=Flavobacterium sp. ARAG 55.4 TaxID=3451357 RepID=UPI003F44C10A